MMTNYKVALDPNLNPTSNGMDSMKHIQFAKHYRELLMVLKKTGHMRTENIPLKEQYTTCLKSPTLPSGEDWELRVLAGSMTLTTTHNGKLILTQHGGIELGDYVESLGISLRSPTHKVVSGKLVLLTLHTIQIGKTLMVDTKRMNVRRYPLGNITRKTTEKDYV